MSGSLTPSPFTSNISKSDLLSSSDEDLKKTGEKFKDFTLWKVHENEEQSLKPEWLAKTNTEQKLRLVSENETVSPIRHTKEMTSHVSSKSYTKSQVERTQTVKSVSVSKSVVSKTVKVVGSAVVAKSEVHTVNGETLKSISSCEEVSLNRNEGEAPGISLQRSIRILPEKLSADPTHISISAVENTVKSLGLDKYYPAKLRLEDLQNLISSNSQKASSGIRWKFLEELLLFDVDDSNAFANETGQSTEGEASTETRENMFWKSQEAVMSLFICSNLIVRRRLAKLLQAWNLPIPLILPATNEIALWSSRTCKAEGEVCFSSSPFPFVSVIQLDEPQEILSSELLNDIFRNGKSHRFFSDPKESPVVCRGMAEVNCHFSTDKNSSEFSASVMAAHIIGDGLLFSRQSKYLYEISDIVCFIAKNLDKTTEFLKSCCQNKRVLILVDNEDQTEGKAQELVNKYKVASLRISTVKDIVQAKESFLAFVTQEIPHISATSLERKVEEAEKHGFCIDEESAYVKDAKIKARDLISQIQETGEPLPLQAKMMERENELEKKCPETGLHFSNVDNLISLPLQSFLQNLKNSDSQQLQYLFDWLDLYLTARCRPAQHEDKANKEASCKTDISVERLLREVSYHWTVSGSEKSNDSIPDVLARLLLEGHALEVFDADANFTFTEMTKKVLSRLSGMLGEHNRICVLSSIGHHDKETKTLLKTMFATSLGLTTSSSSSRVSMELIKVPPHLCNKLKCQYLAALFTSGPMFNKERKLSHGHQQKLTRVLSQLSDIVVCTVNIDDKLLSNTIEDLSSANFLARESAAFSNLPQCLGIFVMSTDADSYQASLESIKTQCSEICKSELQKDGKSRFLNPFDSNANPTLRTISKLMPKFANQYLLSQSERSTYMSLLTEAKSGLAEMIEVCDHVTFSELPLRFDKLTKAKSQKNLQLPINDNSTEEKVKDTQNVYTAQKVKIESNINQWLTNIENKILSSPGALKDQKDSIICEGNKVIEKEINNLEKELTKFEQQQSRVKTDNSTKDDVQRFCRKLSIGMMNAILSSFQQADERLQHSNGFFRGMTQLQQLLKKSTNLSEEQKMNKIEREFLKLCDIYFEKRLTNNVETKGVLAHETLQKCLRERFGKHKHWLEDITYPSLTYEISKKDGQFSRLYSWTIGRYEWIEWVTGNLEWKRTLQDLADKILKESGRDIQGLCSKPALLKEHHCEKVICIVEKRIEEHQDTATPWSQEFKDAVMNIVCNFAIQAFEEMEERYRAWPDYLQAIEETKESYRNLIFTRNESKRHVEIFQKEVVAGILTSFRKRLPVITTECLKERKKELFNIQRVYKDLLSYIEEKKKFQLYMSYISDFKALATSWIRTEVIQFLEEDVDGVTRLSKILLEKTEQTLKAFKVVVDEAHKESQGDYSAFLRAVWMKAMSKNLELGLDSRCIKRLEFLSVTDLDDFVQTFSNTLMNETLAQLNEKIKNLCVEKEIRNAEPKIEEQMHDVLMCTEGAQCPFCGAPCTRLGPHRVHSTGVHYPQGINGFRDTKTKKLVSRNCYESFCTSKKFKDEDTRGRSHSYSKYKKIHPDWEIKAQQNHPQSEFWKKFLIDFNEELALHYNSKPADILN